MVSLGDGASLRRRADSVNSDGLTSDSSEDGEEVSLLK